ncbi:MAG TPA: hypothetical protein DEA61_05890 [Caldanaerobacter subterraneus]|uniref:Uncharacterized protein n=1 Tax=Caldanaerobacter subterraneus TaxID=911092 RepID=A0A357VM43_9THEO|nr:hypothetical protein [Caldanaerobacter subterraneus]
MFGSRSNDRFWTYDCKPQHNDTRGFCSQVAIKENPYNFLIMHAMGPNLAGVFGTAIAGGIMLVLLGVH